MARATWRRWSLPSFRTSRRKDCARSICKVGFEFAAIFPDPARFPFPTNFSIRAFHKSFQISIGHIVLTKRVIVGVDRDGPQSDYFVPMSNADVFAVCRAF